MGAQSWCISIILSIWKLWSLNRIQGVLAGFDQKSNIVLADSKERVYSIDEGVEEIPLGLYLVKGEMMFVPTLFDLRIRVELTWFNLFHLRCLVGEIDEEVDKSVDLATIRAEPIPPIRYGWPKPHNTSNSLSGVFALS